MRWLGALGLFAVGCVANVENVVVVDARPAACATDDAGALAEIERGLSDYGAWSEDDAYGTIWTPNDDAFVPYATDGRFADVNGELLWVSDVPWGTTLHHGRWVRCKNRWSWVPGARYAGSWVTWRRDGERTSWAPAPPTRIWRRGLAVAIAPPSEPVVGSRTADELALVPPDPPPTRLDTSTPAADEDRGLAYRDLARRTEELGDEASASFGDMDGFFGGGGGGRGGSHLAAKSSASHSSGASHGGHISGHGSSGHASSHAHASGGHR